MNNKDCRDRATKLQSVAEVLTAAAHTIRFQQTVKHYICRICLLNTFLVIIIFVLIIRLHHYQW